MHFVIIENNLGFRYDFVTFIVKNHEFCFFMFTAILFERNHFATFCSSMLTKLIRSERFSSKHCHQQKVGRGECMEAEERSLIKQRNKMGAQDTALEY